LVILNFLSNCQKARLLHPKSNKKEADKKGATGRVVLSTALFACQNPLKKFTLSVSENHKSAMKNSRGRKAITLGSIGGLLNF